MDIIETCKEKVKGQNLRVVLPEGGDKRVIQAARRLKDENIAEPIVLGKEEEIESAIAKAHVNLDGIESINPREQSNQLDKFAYVGKYVAQREGAGIDSAVARRMVMKPLCYGGMMVACGDADTMIAGVVKLTSLVIQIGTLTVGLAHGISTASSFFLMILPQFEDKNNKCFIFADCAVNIDPTPCQLADIAMASAASAEKLLGEEARVAMLSFSTKGSAGGEKVDKVKHAVDLVRARDPKLKIDGEFQVDSAINPAVAARKVKEQSDVAGKANVLIFPDLDSGNIAYKLTQYMAGARAIGPFLQGFATPISDVSRGASVDDIVSTTAVTLAML